MKTERDLARLIIDLALSKGADEVEVYIKSSKGISVEIKDREIEALESSLSFGYSLRVIKNQGLGFTYSTEKADIDSVVKDAVEAAKWVDRDRYLELPGANGFGEVDVFDEKIDSIEEDDIVSRVILLEESARREDKRIKRTRKAAGNFSAAKTIIMNSKGLDMEYSSTACTGHITAVAEDKSSSQMGWDFSGSRFLDEVSFEDVGRNAARKALQLLGAKKIEALKAKVILHNSVAADFLRIFASSLSSESVQKGKSLLAGKLGKEVISPKINIVDSGLLSGRLGSRPVDDEGVPSKEKILIKEGLLQGYLYNIYTAKKDGVSSTGNAVRGRFSALPSIGISNLFVEAVSKSDVTSQENLFKADNGILYITEAMGIHLANPISGEFSIGVSGLWIEKGEVKFPVKEAVISGNILDFFGKIEAVGNDTRFYGNLGTPSLLIGPTDISA
ncbi:MAG: TldD/PmbA family protein [Nitrospirota bacterium]